MKHLLYLTGAPASGKSTIAHALTQGLTPVEHTNPAHLHYPQAGVTTLGRNRPDFPGTDTLPLNAITRVLQWLNQPDAPTLLLAEGDRLACQPFFDGARQAGYTVTIAHVTIPTATLTHRRQQRDWHPNPAWLKGRDTKAARQQKTANITIPGDNLTAALNQLNHHPTTQNLNTARNNTGHHQNG